MAASDEYTLLLPIMVCVLPELVGPYTSTFALMP